MNSKSSSRIFSTAQSAKLPAHVAIIMDGNGRWAKKRLLNRIQGHEKGAETVRRIVRSAREIGISHLTLYAFSTENWQRSKFEVDALMTLLVRYLETEQAELVKNDIRLDVIGQIERLPSKAQKALKSTMRQTEKNSAMALHLALSYGGRAEILGMVKSIAAKTSSGEITTDEITDELISKHLYTADIPDPDLLIRTSGEMRISNFLLWQIAYTEIYVTDTLWPDFSREEFHQILENYLQRDRRYGKIKE